MIAAGWDGAITHTISVAEVIWFVIGTIGLTVSWRNLMEAYRDSVALDFAGLSGTLRIIASANMREEVLRVGKCVGIMLAGVIAMAIPPANTHTPTSPLQIIITATFFLIAALIVIGSISAARTRKLVGLYPTESEPPWAATEKGQQGDQGIRGLRGHRGPKGDKGDRGLPGR